MKIAKEFIFLGIVSILLFTILFIFIFPVMENYQNSRMQLGCINAVVDKINDATNHYHLCDNDECKEYFTEKIKGYEAFGYACVKAFTNLEEGE